MQQSHLIKEPTKTNIHIMSNFKATFKQLELRDTPFVFYLLVNFPDFSRLFQTFPEIEKNPSIFQTFQVVTNHDIWIHLIEIIQNLSLRLQPPPTHPSPYFPIRETKLIWEI